VDWLKKRCVKHLMSCPVQLSLMLLARRLGLEELYRRCVEKYARATMDAKSEEQWIADRIELQELSEMEVISDILRGIKKIARRDQREAACNGAFMALQTRCFQGLQCRESLRPRCDPFFDAERDVDVVHYA